MCGEGAVTDLMCQKWFAKFRAGAGMSSLLASLSHSGRSAVLGHMLNTQTLTKTDEQKNRDKVHL